VREKFSLVKTGRTRRKTFFDFFFHNLVEMFFLFPLSLLRFLWSCPRVGALGNCCGKTREGLMRAAALIEGAAANSRARRRVDRKAGRVYDNPLPFWVPPRYYRLPRLLRDPRQLLGDAIIPVYADLGEAAAAVTIFCRECDTSDGNLRGTTRTCPAGVVDFVHVEGSSAKN
jgi:hypothetical protein